MRVMLIEDNPGDAELIRHATKRHPVHMDWVANGEDALSRLREGGNDLCSDEGYDLLLVDLKMPRLGGLGLLEKLKEDPSHATLPVVVLTSSQAPGDLRRAYELGAAACFLKPAAGYAQVMDQILGFFSAASIVPQLGPGGPDGKASRVAAAGEDPGAHLRMQRLAAIVESAADAIIGLSLEDTITSWNPAAEQLYGYGAEEAVGHAAGLLVPEHRQEELTALLDSLRQGASVAQLSTLRVDRGGRKLHIELTLSPTRDASGAVVGQSAIAREITAQRQAEERFRFALEASPSAMVMVDDDGIVEMANAEAERLFGYPRAALEGQAVEVLVPERFRGRHPALRRGFDQRPEPRLMGLGRSDLFGLTREGREVPVEIGLNPIRTASGTRVLCSIVDITERRQADEMLRLAVEASPSGIVIVHEDGTIALVNAETERMFGYARGELHGQSVDVLVPQRFRGQHGHHRETYVADPEKRSMGSGRELHGQRKDGSWFPVEIGLNPIHVGGQLLVLSTIVDITERKRTEAELERQREELTRSNEELEQFAYVASHDLQEPLRMVSSYTALLSEHLGDDLDEDAARFIHFANDGALRMRALIDDLLSLSRVRTRGRELVAVRLHDVIDAALANLQVAIEDAKAQIYLSVPEGVLVMGDASQLTTLIQNLISNALKFRGAERARVHISARGQDGQIRVAVRDNGIGIPPQHAARIFQLFERLHTREEYPGTGIGLAICRRVVERHGGEIFVESDGATGSLFYFSLRTA